MKINRRYIPIVLLLFLLSLLSNSLALAKDYSYTEKTGANTDQTRLSIVEAANNLTIDYENANEVHHVFCHENYATQSWSYKRPAEGTDLLLERVENTIQIKGCLKGKNIQRTLRIDGSPWYQFVSVSLTNFLRSSQKNVYFWAIQPGDLKPYKMSAKKLGHESVDLNGENVITQHIKVSLTGILSVFWKVDYWFRDSDNAFIKFEGVNGPPGSAKTLIELENQ